MTRLQSGAWLRRDASGLQVFYRWRQTSRFLILSNYISTSEAPLSPLPYTSFLSPQIGGKSYKSVFLNLCETAAR